MLELQALSIFVKIIEKGSFSAAARALHKTPSALSKQLRQLETAVGAKLINRTTHALAPTEAGSIFHERCRVILAELDRATEAVQERTEQLSGSLRLQLTPGTGHRFVLPALADFLRLHPKLSAETIMRAELMDPLQSGIDLAIRTGESDDDRLRYANLQCRRLARLRYVIAAAPDYLARNGRPRRPADLAGHNCLIHSRHVAAREWWFTDGKSRYAVEVGGQLVTDDWSSMREAAAAGLGIARLPAPARANGEAADAALPPGCESLFAAESLCDRVIWAIWPRGRYVPRKLSLFLDFLERRLERE